jgi:hypothetical protein
MLCNKIVTNRELQFKSFRLRRDCKPLEFERFNCGEFAIIKKSGGQGMAGLIPSNSTGLEFQAVAAPQN